MYSTAFIAALLVASAPLAHAQATRESGTTVFGEPDCRQWSGSSRPTDRAWLMGYLSGMNRTHNAAGGKPSDPLDAMNSAAQAYQWMDAWCKANPSKSVGVGAFELFLKLMRTKK